MSAHYLILEVQQAGGQIQAAGENLELKAPQPLPDSLIEKIRAHKAEILDALQNEADLAVAEAVAERSSILECAGGLSRTQAEKVAVFAEAFYSHLWGEAKQTGCCHAPVGRYCEEGRRLRDRYYGACS